MRAHEGFSYLNPGSVSLPKGGSARSYMTPNEGVFELKTLADGKTIESLDAQKK